MFSVPRKKKKSDGKKCVFLSIIIMEWIEKIAKEKENKCDDELLLDAVNRTWISNEELPMKLRLFSPSLVSHWKVKVIKLWNKLQWWA